MRCAALWIALAVVGVTSTMVGGREWVDASGKFRIEAELVAFRNGKAILEKVDGTIITIPLERLSPADQAFLKSQAAKPAAEPPSPKSASPPAKSTSAESNLSSRPTVPATELAKKTEQIFRAACYRCHGEDGASEGGFNFVLNLEKVARTLVPSKQARESLLFQRLAATDDRVMPPIGEQPRVSANELATIQEWIEAGAPALPNEEPRELISNDQVTDFILADVRKKTERSRRFMRYFTLTHLYNAGVSKDELQTYRNAFAKLINSLSWNTDLVVPAPIDPAETVLGVDMRQLHWTAETWSALEEANPYHLELSSPSALACYTETQTNMPSVRIDWFVFAASKPPLYHSVLGVPDTDRGLEEMLRVNVLANIEQEQAIRAAFNRSGISQNNRLIEWHKSPYGSYWKSYDFGGNTGQQNLFEYPLGPGTESHHFQQDGGEMLFTLPNGLQGYFLADGQGKRIDQGPTSIVSDPKRPDKTVTNGVSCMSCHYTGTIPKRDELGDAVRANRAAYEDADDILALYRESEEMNAVFAEDAKRFAAALKKIGINSLSRSGEPISAMAMRFEQDIDLPHVAAEFGLPPAEFEKRLEHADKTARAFSSLKTSGGTMKREVMATLFREAAAELRLTRGNNPPASSSRVAASSRTPVRSSRPAAEKNAPVEAARFGDLGWGVASLAFSPNGKLLAAGKTDRSIQLFDVADKSKVHSVDRLEMLQAVKGCTFTPDGSRLLAAGMTGQILVYSVSSEGVLKETGQFAGHSQEVKCIAVSPDGKFAISGGQEKKARYWEISSGRERVTLPALSGPVKAVHISRNGRIAQVTDGAVLMEFDLVKSDVKRQRPLARSWSSGQAAAFSTDGGLIAVGDTYNIRVWNTATGQELRPLEGNEIQWSLVFSADGNRLLSGSNGKVSLWDVRKQQRVHVQAIAGNGYIQTLAASPDGKLFAAIPNSAGQDLQVFRIPNN